jgi:hypothetical protein
MKDNSQCGHGCNACIQQDACWLQGVGGIGYWRAEKKMEKAHEKV